MAQRIAGSTRPIGYAACAACQQAQALAGSGAADTVAQHPSASGMIARKPEGHRKPELLCNSIIAVQPTAVKPAVFVNFTMHVNGRQLSEFLHLLAMLYG
jgi:hypothetical protein